MVSIFYISRLHKTTTLRTIIETTIHTESWHGKLRLLQFCSAPINFHSVVLIACIPFQRRVTWNMHHVGVDTLRPRQNGRHFTDDIFKCILSNENVWIPIKISLKLVPKGQINKIQALVQILPWRRPGDKPLSEPMVVSIPTHICVTRPQRVKCLLLGKQLHEKSRNQLKLNLFNFESTELP